MYVCDNYHIHTHIYYNIYIYIYDYDDDGIRFIIHRYKVITLIVSARKLNNSNKTQQPQKTKKLNGTKWK